jgi:hypothetical protein
MDSLQRRRVDDRTRGRRRVRVVTALAAIGSGVLATVLSLLLTGTAATASTTTSSTSNTSGDTTTQQNTQSNSDQLQAPTTAPAQTYIGGGYGSSGGS